MRKRATAIVEHEGRILLVMERGHHHWSLPGGGVEHHEHSWQAVTRELREETGLHGYHPHFLFHYEGTVNHHSVYLIRDIAGSVHLQHRELKDYCWWGGFATLPMQHSTKAILRQYRQYQQEHYA